MSESDTVDLINFGKALKEFRLNANKSQEELAFESNLDRTYISMLERNIKVPTLTTIIKLSKALGISPTVLFSRSLLFDNHHSSLSKNKEVIRTPFMGTAVSCGKPISENYVIEKEISLDEILIKKADKTFFVKASGDSMAPTIWDGDLLVILLSNKYKNNDIVLAQLDNEFTIKRYFKSDKGVKLLADNSLFSEITLSENSTLQIIGVIKNIVRSF